MAVSNTYVYFARAPFAIFNICCTTKLIQIKYHCCQANKLKLVMSEFTVDSTNEENRLKRIWIIIYFCKINAKKVAGFIKSVCLYTGFHSTNFCKILYWRNLLNYVVGSKSFRPDQLFKVTEIKQICYFST